MDPFEALYGRRCRSPIGWFDSAEMDSLDTDLLRDAMEQVRMIQYRLLAAQSRQKSYADRRVRALVFMEGDHVWLRVSPMKGVMRFGKEVKLSPRFIGPFEILSRVERWPISWPCHLVCRQLILFSMSLCFGSIFRMNLMCFHLSLWSWVQT